jgi:hypothetical protein
MPAAEVADDYLADVDPLVWTWAAYALRYSTEQLRAQKVRRQLCRLDPLLFAVLYLKHHLSSTETHDQISISPFHVDVCRAARQWTRKDISEAAVRDAWIAPRGSGKSTWAFLILPLWALAYRHRKYIAAYANSASQAEGHLASLKDELDNNDRLREDFPKLCRAKRRPNGMVVADRHDIYIAESGVAFTAKGIDSSTLGAKIGRQRPDAIILDDIEPDASNYSPGEKEKRLATVLNALMPMNLNAVVWFVGTTVMNGSIIHDIVRQEFDSQAPEWPVEEKIRVHYYNAILTDAAGVERSLWPQRWSLEFLASIRHTASYKLNFENKPVSQGGWWQPGDIKYGRLEGYDRIAMFVDGAVTAKATSDETGITIMGLSLAQKRIYILEAIGVRLTGEPRRRKILELCETHDVDYIMCEANQGGDLWHMELHHMPVKVVTFVQKEPKSVRIRRFLALYQRAGGRILHAKVLPMLENQQASYPNLLHEDVLDSASAGGEHMVGLLFASGPAATRARSSITQHSYR